MQDGRNAFITIVAASTVLYALPRAMAKPFSTRFGVAGGIGKGQDVKRTFTGSSPCYHAPIRRSIGGGTDF